jgi:4'-phosphopantetheinyl transferase EntD
MIEEILPAAVAAAEAFEDPPHVSLFPEEEALISRAVDKRRREFGTARACARRALAKLGRPPVPIVSGERGAPVWPDGIVGSITHCAGYRASAVAEAHDILTLGIDAEPHEKLPGDVLEVIARPEELTALGAMDGTVCWDRLLFSAKETVYKAWFPLARRWLGFEMATLTFEEDGTFRARILIPGPVTGFTGRWTVSGGFVATAIAVPGKRGMSECP